MFTFSLTELNVCLQVEELKTIPNEPSMSAPELVAKALDHELNAAGSAAAAAPAALPVNDLTSVVKKKKKPAAESNSESNTATKRKAEDEGLNSPTDKKAKLEEGAATS